MEMVIVVHLKLLAFYSSKERSKVGGKIFELSSTSLFYAGNKHTHRVDFMPPPYCLALSQTVL